MKFFACAVLGMFSFVPLFPIQNTAVHNHHEIYHSGDIPITRETDPNAVMADSIPYYITVDSETVIQRSFMFYDQKVLPYCISVGTTEKINYSINSLNGSIIKGWKGQFLNANLMWIHKARGIGVAQPVGEEIELGNAKAFASSLSDWGDSVKIPDSCAFLGYDVDKNNNPVFRYRFNSVEIKDSIRVAGERLQRTLHPIAASPVEIYYKLIEGKEIRKQSAFEYVVDDRIKVTATGKDLILETQNHHQLLIEKTAGELTYYISWK